MWCKFDGLQLELSQTNIDEVGTELKQLEEKLHLWREVRQKTIAELRLHWQGRQTDRDSQGCRVWWLGPGWRPHPGRGRDDCPHRGGGTACPRRRGGPRPRKRPHRRLCCPVLLSRKQSHEWMLEQVRISAQRLCPHGPITSYHQLSLQSKYSATVQLKVRSAAIKHILSGDHRNSGNDTADGWELKGLAGTWPECRQTRRLMVKHSDKWF